MILYVHVTLRKGMSESYKKYGHITHDNDDDNVATK